MKKALFFAASLLLSWHAQAGLTPEQQTALAALVKQARIVLPTANSEDVYSWIRSQPQTGTTNIVSVATKPDAMQLAEKKLLALLTKYGLSKTNTLAQVQDTFAAAFTIAATTNAKFVVLDDKATAFSLWLFIIQQRQMAEVDGSATTTFTRPEPVYGPSRAESAGVPPGEITVQIIETIERAK